MEIKEEKKERRQGYFARLKKKKQAKQNAETAAAAANSRGTTGSKTQVGKDEGSKVILEQVSSEDNCKFAEEKEERVTEEEKRRKKYNHLKDIRRTELKRYYTIAFPQMRFSSPLHKVIHFLNTFEYSNAQVTSFGANDHYGQA